MKGNYGNKPAGGVEKNKAKQSQSPGFARKICKQHWRRHRNKMDDFDLFDAFGDRRPAGFLTPAFSLSVLNIRIGFKYLDRSRLPDVQTETLRLGVKLRCVHALYRGHACLVFSLVLDTGTVFEDIHALRQIVHEKVRRSVARTLVVAQTRSEER